MRDLWKIFIQFFTSLRLTVVLLALSMVLIFVATLDQTNLGIYAIQEKYFRSFLVITAVPGTQIHVPIYPGGYLIGGLLLINLVVTHVYRFRLSWKKSGIWLTHLGLILLLVGELLTGLWQEDFRMMITEGETRNYSESYHFNELAIIDTSNPEWDDVVAIPEELLTREESIQHPKLPFQVLVKAYYPNAGLMRREQVPNAPPSPATAGFGAQFIPAALPKNAISDEIAQPVVAVEFMATGGQSLGTYLLSVFSSQPESFTYEGKTWNVSLRVQRNYHPFLLKLLKVSHDVYPGSEIPKNYSSRVLLKTDEKDPGREVLIYMNNPLRHAGLTFYQNQMNAPVRQSGLQVVRNPSWQLPYYAFIISGVGLSVHFFLSLWSFLRRKKPVAPTPSPAL